MGISAERLRDLTRFQQMRPLTAGQPWGVFFLQFEGTRLPVTQLRQLLRGLVKKKRNSKNSLPTWEEQDLLFVVFTGHGLTVEVHFVAFFDEGNSLPIIRSLTWRPHQSPLHHLQRIALELLPALEWPNDVADTSSWRASWRTAFKLRHGEAIASASKLAEKMAQAAIELKSKILEALREEPENGPFTRIFGSIKWNLVEEISEDETADMCAQTITYGVLSSRLIDPESFGASPVFSSYTLSNPFLTSFFEEVYDELLSHGDQAQKLEALIEDLKVTNVEAVIDQFGSRIRGRDPVIHFYEEFLKQYNSDVKVERGVFYTPQPVVKYIVRRLHNTLQREFQLADGLADTSTWSEVCGKLKGLDLPKGIDGDSHFVKILDPATGTGTFLVEVIEVIHETMIVRWEAEGATQDELRLKWQGYVSTHLIPRLYGFELMMAPYAIAHVKVGLKLAETGVHIRPDERLNIYLTNSLAPPLDNTTHLSGILPALAKESQEVVKIKSKVSFTVLLGNPPYANYSANLDDQARQLVERYRYFNGKKIKERNMLQFERNIQDDFVKFLALAENEIRASQYGVMGLITNSVMLSSKSLRGLRQQLMTTFSHIEELDLHGGLNEKVVADNEDENVFDISQAVAIHVLARRSTNGASSLVYAELMGSREDKFDKLESISHLPDHTTVIPNSLSCSFRPREESQFSDSARLNSIFVQYGAGIKTNRDKIAIGFTPDQVLAQVGGYDPSITRNEERLPIRQILYRPYDLRWIYYHRNVVSSLSQPTMQHLLAGPNFGLIASSTWTTPSRFSVGMSDTIAEMKSGTHDRGTTVFPLYCYSDLLGMKVTKNANFESQFVQAWEEITGLSISLSGDQDNICDPFLPFCWLYGLFHSSQYRKELRSDLADGFPIVLLPGTSNVLEAISRLGQQLIELQTLRNGRASADIRNFVGRLPTHIETCEYSDESIWLDYDHTVGFVGIVEEEWDYYQGGYRVCEKWLKDRKVRKGQSASERFVLTEVEVGEFQHVVYVVRNTLRIIQEIDTVMDGLGVWPEKLKGFMGTNP